MVIVDGVVMNKDELGMIKKRLAVTMPSRG